MSDSSSSPVFLTPGEDPAMEQAVKRARQTFRYFWRECSWERRRIIPGLDIAVVKVAFQDPPETPKPDPNQPAVEQMWISDVDFDGQFVYGTLINSPNWLTSVREGDEVKIKPGDVSDWMYAIEGRAYGAFTVNVMRKNMGRGERSGHDQAWGLDFGDPDSFTIVPPEYIGQSAAKNGLLSRLTGGGRSGSQDVAEVAKHEHPMAINMGDSLSQAVQENPEMLHQADDRGMTLLHQLALAGSPSGVSILLRHGADPEARAANGATPLQLAKALGWKQAMQVLSQATR